MKLANIVLSAIALMLFSELPLAQNKNRSIDEVIAVVDSLHSVKQWLGQVHRGHQSALILKEHFLGRQAFVGRYFYTNQLHQQSGLKIVRDVEKKKAAR